MVHRLTKDSPRVGATTVVVTALLFSFSYTTNAQIPNLPQTQSCTDSGGTCYSLTNKGTTSGTKSIAAYADCGNESSDCGQNVSATGCTAIVGESAGQAGYGVYGHASCDDAYGIYGQADVYTSYGVYGNNGDSSQTSGVGVWGNSYGIGVEGYSIGAASGGGTGVLGQTAATSAGIGVTGQSSSHNGWGVYGHSSNSTGGIGVEGIAAVGYGVTGIGTTAGVYGQSGTSSDNGIVGIFGTATVNSSYSNSGVYGASSSGNGVVGTTSAAASAVAGVATSSGNGLYGYASGSGDGVYGFSGTGTAIYAAGNIVYTGTLTHSSDARLKKDIKTLEGSLERILKLRGVSYEWKDPSAHGNAADPQIGFIAQEVEKEFPGWIGHDEAGMKTLSTDGLGALLVESVRTLEAQNEALKERVAALEGRRVLSSAGFGVSGFGGFAGFGLATAGGAFILGRKRGVQGRRSQES